MSNKRQREESYADWLCRIGANELPDMGSWKYQFGHKSESSDAGSLVVNVTVEDEDVLPGLERYALEFTEYRKSVKRGNYVVEFDLHRLRDDQLLSILLILGLVE